MAETRHVQANGLSFSIRLDRAGDAAPWLVFSNSLVTDLTIWDDQVRAFAGRFNMLRYDQRGHGGTSLPDGPADFAQLADDVVQIMAAVGIGRCTYVGLSMGVPTGLQLFSARPDLIERLVLCDGGATTTPERGRLWADRIAAARRDGMGPYTDETMERWYSPSFLASGRADKARAVMLGTAVEGFAACASALQAYDLSAVLPMVSVPTLLIAGERDGDVPNAMRRLVGIIPSAAFEEIPGAGHIPNLERPDEFNDALNSFLAASESVRSGVAGRLPTP